MYTITERDENREPWLRFKHAVRRLSASFTLGEIYDATVGLPDLTSYGNIAFQCRINLTKNELLNSYGIKLQSLQTPTPTWSACANSEEEFMLFILQWS